jgi:hypothetical protein
MAGGRVSQGGDLFDNSASKIRYEAYSRLQAAAVAFGEQIEVPEIVCIGGQVRRRPPAPPPPARHLAWHQLLRCTLAYLTPPSCLRASFAERWQV